MRNFKLFILTICIISNIGEYNAFCSNDSSVIDGNADNCISAVSDEDVILNIPTKNFFTKYYNRFTDKKYSFSNNL